MLECYQAYADYHDMMDAGRGAGGGAGAGRARRCRRSSGEGATLDFTPPFGAGCTFVDGIRAALGARRAARRPSRRCARRCVTQRSRARRGGDAGRPASCWTRCSRRSLEPTLVQPTFVLDYPRALSPLAKPHRGDPALTERFELFVGGRELANAFSELNDPDDQRRRFEDQVRAARRRRRRGAACTTPTTCARWSTACRRPAGSGIGIDRLVMLLDRPGHHPRRDPVSGDAAGGIGDGAGRATAMADAAVRGRRGSSGASRAATCAAGAARRVPRSTPSSRSAAWWSAWRR